MIIHLVFPAQGKTCIAEWALDTFNGTMPALHMQFQIFLGQTRVITLFTVVRSLRVKLSSVVRQLVFQTYWKAFITQCTRHPWAFRRITLFLFSDLLMFFVHVFIHFRLGAEQIWTLGAFQDVFVVFVYVLHVHLEIRLGGGRKGRQH